jgi:DNA-directed RNA polymerase subunit K/omega
MISRRADVNSFEFVIVSALRTAQLVRGCTPRVPASEKRTVTAQREVAAGKVSRTPIEP